MQEVSLLPEVIFICIGTPADKNGSLDVEGLKKGISDVFCQILRLRQENITIAIRSTLPLGTINELNDELLNTFAAEPNLKPNLVYNPEFLREGSAVLDFENPEVVVLGINSDSCAKSIVKVYEPWNEKLVVCGLAEAEIIKSINNTWHALKISFANEVGSLCDSLGLNKTQVFNVFKRDRKLNISDAYLSPAILMVVAV